MPRKEYTSLPTNYPVCEHNDCPMATNCLHQIAHAIMLKNEEYLRLINPTRCTKDTSCAYYRSNSPMLYARGFTNFQRRMFPDQYRRFMEICVGEWGRNPYFERRRGARLIPISEQEFILKVLKIVGVTEEMQLIAMSKLSTGMTNTSNRCNKCICSLQLSQYSPHVVLE